MQNTWFAKLVRTVTSFLPVEKGRRGRCNQCGECCFLPNRCSFVYFVGKKARCKIYDIRPLNCRKYPRTKEEQICKNCSFKFD